jgi:hypothetical protein
VPVNGAGFTMLPERAETRLARLLLAVPDLIALGLPEMIASAAYPSVPGIAAATCLLVAVSCNWGPPNDPRLVAMSVVKWYGLTDRR